MSSAEFVALQLEKLSSLSNSILDGQVSHKYNFRAYVNTRGLLVPLGGML